MVKFVARISNLVGPFVESAYGTPFFSLSWQGFLILSLMCTRDIRDDFCLPHLPHEALTTCPTDHFP